ncbi:MAG: O-antigen ligase family protein [Patescibacteria group bacterium]|nr:O-antigen ligase family protein [Patescibacteria group bacterium]
MNVNSFTSFYPVIVIAYVIFILLMPKITLFGLIPTPVRIEDFLLVPILIGFVFFLIEKKKISKLSKIGLNKYILIWLCILLLSTVTGLITGMLHDYTGFLFWLRFIEYLVFFYLAYISLRNPLGKKFVYILIVLTFPITVYAILQRMGIVGGFGGGFYQYRWVLGTDRAFSTFSGPYELAAFYVMAIPLIASQILFNKKLFLQLALWFLFLLNLIGLALTSARVPILAIFFSMLIFFVYAKNKILVVLLLILSITVPFFASSTLTTRFEPLVSAGLDLAMKTVGINKNLILTNKEQTTLIASRNTTSSLNITTEATGASDLISQVSTKSSNLTVTKTPELSTTSAVQASAPAIPVVPLKENLLSTSNFETSFDTWLKYGNVTLRTLELKNGDIQKYVLVNYDNTQTVSYPAFGLGLTRTISGLNPKKTYELSVWYYKELGSTYDKDSRSWVSPLYWHAYRGGKPLSLNRDVKLILGINQAPGSWVLSKIDFSSVDELRAVPPVGFLPTGKIRIDQISLVEIDDNKNILEPVTEVAATPPAIDTSNSVSGLGLNESSLNWRLDVTWARVINMLKKNPILGGGLSSVGVGVDSEYMTLLGESGIVGLVIFLLLIMSIVLKEKQAFKNFNESTQKSIVLGVFVGTIGLLLNASFADVFRASKVAILFWFLTGLVLTRMRLEKTDDEQKT